MVRLFLLRVLTIALILFLLATSVFMLEQYKIAKEEIEVEEVATTMGETTMHEEIIHTGDATSSTAEIASANENPISKQAEPITRVDPGMQFRGSRLLTHDMGRVFVVNLENSAVEQVYTVDPPWYLVAYDLAPDGMVALIVEQSKGSKEIGDYENQTRLILLNSQTSDQPLILEYASDYGLDFYEMQTLTFSPDGKYLLVDDRGWDYDRYKVYRMQCSPYDLQMLKEVNGDGLRDVEVIGFDATSSAIYFRCKGERVTVYEHNLAKQYWRKVLSDQVIPYYQWIAQGEVFSVVKTPDKPKELQIVKISR